MYMPTIEQTLVKQLDAQLSHGDISEGVLCQGVAHTFNSMILPEPHETIQESNCSALNTRTTDDDAQFSPTYTKTRHHNASWMVQCLVNLLLCSTYTVHVYRELWDADIGEEL